MKLFDDLENTNLVHANYSNPNYSIWNSSNKLELVEARKVIEEWFTDYPDSSKAEFTTRFRSESNSQHRSALFELLLFKTLLNLGCQVHLHPEIEGTNNSPDFFANSKDGGSFYLEATVSNYKTTAQLAADSRINTVYDILNEKLESPDFFLELDVEGTPDTQPPAGKIVKFLTSKLSEVDRDEIALLYEKDRLDNIPT